MSERKKTVGVKKYEIGKDVEGKCCNAHVRGVWW